MPQDSRFTRQSLVPFLGWIALSLFLINFVTYLSNQVAPDRCSKDRTARMMYLFEGAEIDVPGEAEVERMVREAEREIRKAEREVRRAERAARHAEVEARSARARVLHERPGGPVIYAR